MTSSAAIEELLAAARQAARGAYCPYSKFRVGAAVAAGGRVFTGCNVENASYGLTMCAERTAVLKAVSEGVRRIGAIAVSCIDAAGGPGAGEPALRMPCGACRQVIAEFAAADTPVIVDGAGVFRLDQLLPAAFRLTSHSG